MVGQESFMNHQCQLIVIGSGSGGKDAAILAARAGLGVLLVEKQSLGGTCFYRGAYAIGALRACAERQRLEDSEQRPDAQKTCRFQNDF
jgi:pyruvate/2-oxoglutarate dehydrogenase complex dihydrolipoamide dehydrogenase (E3) component